MEKHEKFFALIKILIILLLIIIFIHFTYDILFFRILINIIFIYYVNIIT